MLLTLIGSDAVVIDLVVLWLCGAECKERAKVEFWWILTGCFCCLGCHLLDFS